MREKLERERDKDTGGNRGESKRGVKEGWNVCAVRGGEVCHIQEKKGSKIGAEGEVISFTVY